MASVNYSQYSPYTKVTQSYYLAYNLPAPIYPADSDVLYTIPILYDEQPWKVARNYYGNERLYYIFALVNFDTISDPVYDFKAGTEIRIPTLERVQAWLQSTRKVN